jgi:hypothetical protein
MTHELLAHLTDASNDERIRAEGLKIEGHYKHVPVIYFHRLRPIRGSHTLDYLRRYAGVSDQIVVVVDPGTLDRDKLTLTRFEATYASDIPPELIRIYGGRKQAGARRLRLEE